MLKELFYFIRILKEKLSNPMLINLRLLSSKEMTSLMYT